MRVLVVENEIYLAQSITAKLHDAGYEAEFCATTKEAFEHKDIDVLLLSSNFTDQLFHLLIDQHKEKIIILMVSYINTDTVIKPMSAGVLDYILKPFMIEELIRKIEHFRKFRTLELQNRSLAKYIDVSLSGIYCEEIGIASTLPLLVTTNHQRCADSYAFKLASEKSMPLFFHQLESGQIDPDIPHKSFVYLSGLENLRRGEKQKIFDDFQNHQVLISSTNSDEELLNKKYRVKQLNSQTNRLGEGEFMSIEEYVKLAILSNQNRLPDTELSKKLGISRKSLWEKRKKYGIHKN